MTMAEKALDYEKAMERLEEIVKELESGSAKLDDMVRLYEEGQKLHAQLSGILDSYEKKIAGLAADGKENEI